MHSTSCHIYNYIHVHLYEELNYVCVVRSHFHVVYISHCVFSGRWGIKLPITSCRLVYGTDETCLVSSPDSQSCRVLYLIHILYPTLILPYPAHTRYTCHYYQVCFVFSVGK